MTASPLHATAVPAPVVPALTVRRYIDLALICSACCR
ncbi:hypothetical protein FHR36_001609 [Kitasatospora paracochleata]|uniref:Uncharacterized protein n=1 Tax=Kitasatospora paracochleata TaxID=58354 RepID=A0ABT1ITM4_9ACTN|nr:hypothetical protein [Kitasatospora paracochleata]